MCLRMDVFVFCMTCVCCSGRGCRTGLTSSGERPVGKITEKYPFKERPKIGLPIRVRYILWCARCHLCDLRVFRRRLFASSYSGSACIHFRSFFRYCYHCLECLIFFSHILYGSSQQLKEESYPRVSGYHISRDPIMYKIHYQRFCIVLLYFGHFIFITIYYRGHSLFFAFHSVYANRHRTLPVYEKKKIPARFYYNYSTLVFYGHSHITLLFSPW